MPSCVFFSGVILGRGVAIPRTVVFSGRFQESRTLDSHASRSGSKLGSWLTTQNCSGNLDFAAFVSSLGGVYGQGMRQDTHTMGSTENCKAT